MLSETTPKHLSKIYVTSFLKKETQLDKFFKSIGAYKKYLELKENRANSDERENDAQQKPIVHNYAFSNPVYSTCCSPSEKLSSKGMFPSVPAIEKNLKSKKGFFLRQRKASNTRNASNDTEADLIGNNNKYISILNQLEQESNISNLNKTHKNITNNMREMIEQFNQEDI